MKSIKRHLATIVVIGTAVLALLFALILTGAVKKVVNTADIPVLGTITTTTTSTINFLGLAFGGSKIVTTVVSGENTNITEYAYDGGMSIFALIAFILILSSIVVMLVSALMKKKKIALIGSILLVLAGIASFLILVVGTDVSVTTSVDTILGNLSNTTVTPFAEQFAGYKLGAGAIVCGALCILGGLFGAYKSIKR